MIGLKRRKYLNRHTNEEIVEAIKSSFSYKQVAETLGYNRTASEYVKRFASEYNVSVSHFSSENYRKYTLDEHFFKNLNQEKVVYWLGFCMADGCLSKTNVNSFVLKIKLQIKDEVHLSKFLNHIGSNSPIHIESSKILKKGCKEYICQPTCRIEISSKIIGLDLINLSCIPNKTKHGCKISELIPHQMMKHFVRGYFDGDGYILAEKTKYNNDSWNKNGQIIFGLTGHITIMTQIHDFLVHELNLNHVKIQDYKTYASFRWKGSRQCKKIYEWIYGESTVCLDRKKEIYDNYYAHYNDKKIYWTPEKLLTIAKQSNSWQDFFKQMGYTTANYRIKSDIVRILINNGWDCSMSSVNSSTILVHNNS